MNKIGTATGTFLTVVYNIQSADIIQTAILAAVGAAVSFLMTVLMKKLLNYRKKQ